MNISNKKRKKKKKSFTASEETPKELRVLNEA